MPPRVVSLIASATEIVAAFGCGDWLVGRSHECDFPPEVRHLPVCSRPNFDIQGTSREIDERVKQSLANALSIYAVDVDRLRELQPDIVITQDQCDVCAVSVADVEAALCNDLGSQVQLVTLSPHALVDVWADIQRVAEALGIPQQGRQLQSQLQQRLSAIQTVTVGLPRRRVACLEWIDPLMAGGNWMPELIHIAGGEALFATAGQHSRYFEWEQLLAADPEVIIAMPCGWDIPKAREELTLIAGRPGWQNLQAVRSGHVYLTDGNQYFNRPGPRLVESTEILATILHPGQIRSPHNDSVEKF